MQSSFQFINEYFTHEKNISILFIVNGCISVFIAVLFFGIIKYAFYKGMASAFLILGFLQLIVGFSVFSQTNSLITLVSAAFNNNNNFEKNSEIERVHQVISSLSVFKISEIICVLIGMILILSCKQNTQKFWKGIGLALTIQASLIFIFDFIAYNNATLYLNTLMQLV